MSVTIKARRIAILMAALLVLAGCGKSGVKPSGRWAVIPASTALETGGASTFSAWRLDTITGDLELCQYASRPVNGTLAESLKCSQAAKGPGNSVNIDLRDNSSR